MPLSGNEVWSAFLKHDRNNEPHLARHGPRQKWQASHAAFTCTPLQKMQMPWSC